MNKKWILPGVLIVVLLIVFFSYNKYHVAPQVKFQNLALVDLQQQPVNFLSFRGKKLVVCFSASWCGNCRQELRALGDIKQTELRDVEVLVISDEPLEKVKAFSSMKNYPFTFLKMTGSFNSIGIYSIPTTYIVDRSLQIKKEAVGYMDWKDPSTARHLKKLMD